MRRTQHGVNVNSTFTLGTNHILLQRQLSRRSVVQIFERHFQWVDDVLALVSTLPASTASEEHVEDVERVVTVTVESSLLDRLLTTLVVQLALLRVRQRLVSIRDFFKLKASNFWLFIYEEKQQSWLQWSYAEHKPFRQHLGSCPGGILEQVCGMPFSIHPR